MPAQYAKLEPNEQTMVERKLTGVYGHATVEIPFWIYEKFAEHAYEALCNHGIKIDLVTIMDNSLMQRNFEAVLSDCCKDLADLQDLEYCTPQVNMIYKAELDEAKRKIEEAQQEEKRKALLESQARIAQEAKDKVMIEISKENQAKARALLDIAGLL